jgi:hypothetical protein
MKFLLLFTLWATLLFAPAWWLQQPWQQAIAAVAGRAAAPVGTHLEMVELELFYPFDVVVFAALCLASGWTGWTRRLRALALGLPCVVVAEVLALAYAFAAVLAASRRGDAEALAGATRLADGLIRIIGLGVAAGVWFAVIGRERLAPGRR